MNPLNVDDTEPKYREFTETYPEAKERIETMVNREKERLAQAFIDALPEMTSIALAYELLDIQQGRKKVS